MSLPLPLQVQTAPLCPEIRLHLLSPRVDLEGPARDTLAEAAPFWAFCWASGQVLARHLLDHPGLVRGRRVVDLGSGSGVVAIAAALAGASRAAACDIDPAALEACASNAALNGVSLARTGRLESELSDCDVLLAADVCYEPATVRLLLDAGERVDLALLCDPERRPLCEPRLERLGATRARTLPEVDEETEGASLFRILPPEGTG